MPCLSFFHATRWTKPPGRSTVCGPVRWCSRTWWHRVLQLSPPLSMSCSRKPHSLSFPAGRCCSTARSSSSRSSSCVRCAAIHPQSGWYLISWFGAWQLCWIDAGVQNEGGSTLLGHIRPHPLGESHDLVASLGEEHDMDGGPCQPGDKPTQLPPARFQNGEVAADHRHIPFIEVVEWPGRRLA